MAKGAVAFRIDKYCDTLKQAEDFQDDLYDEYESVRLIGFPSFSESGLYVWTVKEKGEV